MPIQNLPILSLTLKLGAGNPMGWTHIVNAVTIRRYSHVVHHRLWHGKSLRAVVPSPSQTRAVVRFQQQWVSVPERRTVQARPVRDLLCGERDLSVKMSRSVAWLAGLYLGLWTDSSDENRAFYEICLCTRLQGVVKPLPEQG